MSSRLSTGGFGECPGQRWGDLGSRPALPMLGPVPQGKTLSPQLSYPNVKRKVFPTRGPSVSFKRRGLSCAWRQRGFWEFRVPKQGGA